MKTKAKFGGQNVNRNEIKMWNIPKVRISLILQMVLREICAQFEEIIKFYS